MWRASLFLFLAFAGGLAAGEDRLVSIDTRPGVRVGYWMMERPAAAATLVLLPGGAGAIGMRDGAPQSQNFLVRSRDSFADAGYNVAVVGRPSDRVEMDAVFRAGDENVADLRAVIAKLRSQYGKPVWLVGTSLGTLSAAAVAAAPNPPPIAGIVLTSSVTGVNRAVRTSVPQLDLAAIHVPVLVMHHKRDECTVCDPRQARRIVDALANAPAKKLLLVEGGAGAAGNPCEALHWHGYVGMEAEAVAAIVDFVRNPMPEK